MKTFVVGFLSAFDNELILEKIEALDWRAAISQHSKMQEPSMAKWFSDMKGDLEKVKEEFFNTDIAIGVIDI